jgi:hypothetical protein
VWANFLHLFSVSLIQLMRRMPGMRSFIIVGVFIAAGVVALAWPLVAMTLIRLCLIGYLRPDIPTVGKSDAGDVAA